MVNNSNQKEYKTDLSFDELRKDLDQIVSSIGIDYFTGQRWFGRQADEIKEMNLVDQGILFSEDEWQIFMVIISVDFKNTSSQLYYLPLLISQKPEVAEHLLLIKNPDYQAYIYDAVHTLSYNQYLDRIISNDGIFVMEKGHLEFRRIYQGKVTGSHPLTEVSSNSVTLVKKEKIIKTYRCLVQGVNPDIEIGIILQQETDYFRFPFVEGYIIYTDKDFQKYSLALVEEYVPNEGDLWAYTQDYLLGLCKEITDFYNENNPEKPGKYKREPENYNLNIDKYIEEMERLGEDIADLHLTLASVERENFVPVAISEAELRDWQWEITVNTGRLLSYLKERDSFYSGQVQKIIDELIENEDDLYTAIKKVVFLREHMGQKIRVHGDLHLEQILKTEKGYYVIDFEGEPSKEVAIRRRRYSPLKDIAGVFRSFSYAAQAALLRFLKSNSRILNYGLEEPLKEGLEFWKNQVSRAFLNKYYQRVREKQPEMLPEEDWINTVLAYFQLDKALYETIYEANNRPDWLEIPLRGIMDCFSELRALKIYDTISRI